MLNNLNERAVTQTISVERDFCDKWNMYKRRLRIKQSEVLSELINNPPKELIPYEPPVKDLFMCSRAISSVSLKWKDKIKLQELDNRGLSNHLKLLLYTYMKTHPIEGVEV